MTGHLTLPPVCQRRALQESTSFFNNVEEGSRHAGANSKHGGTPSAGII